MILTQKKPQAKGLVPNLQYKIQMETLDTLSGHTQGGQRRAHNTRGSVGLESRTYHTRGERPDHQLEPVLESRGEEGHSRDRREVAPTATCMQ